jgi:hypothetical protein
MILRAVLVLLLVAGLSVAATLVFGDEVLIAVGLIAVKLKLLALALFKTPLPGYLAWVKAQAEVFLRVEVLKTWVTGSVMPLLLGNAALRRVRGWLSTYLGAVRGQYARLMDWYGELPRAGRLLAAAILLLATVALSVTTLGLWLILLSVQLPLWMVAAGGALGRMIWQSVQKSVFRALAWLQLGWLWRAVKAALPRTWLRRKRRVEVRLARAVIRRRKLTVAQLHARKDRLPFRLGVLVEMLWR